MSTTETPVLELPRQTYKDILRGEAKEVILPSGDRLILAQK